MSRDERDLHHLFRRDLGRIELPHPGAWQPSAAPPAHRWWERALAIPAAAGVIAAALLVAFVIQLVRGDLQQSARPSSPSPTLATQPAVASPSSAPTATPTAPPSVLRSFAPVTTAGVTIASRLPATGQFALILTRSYDQSPTDPSQASGPARLPTTDAIRAVPLSARATTPKDTLSLLSFTSAVQQPGLTIGTTNLLREQLSPDGRRLVLSVVVAGDAANAHAALVIVDLVAGTATPLVQDPKYNDDTPAWSPKGDAIAFVRASRGGTPGQNDASIWVVRADGSGLRRVLGPSANAPEATSVLSWNGDGSRIGYSRGFEDSRYYVLDPVTGASSAIGDRFIVGRGLGDWREGARAFAGAFMQGPHGGAQLIVTADQQGANADTVVTGSALDGNTFFAQARWRPGSDDLLYVRTSVEGQTGTLVSSIYVTDAGPGGRAPREIRTVRFERVTAAWSPDGRDVVYLEGLGVAGSVHLIAPDGSNDRVAQAFGGAPEGKMDWLDLAVLSL